MTHSKAEARAWQAAYNRSLTASYRAKQYGVDAHAKAIRAGDAAVRKLCVGKRCIRGRLAG